MYQNKSKGAVATIIWCVVSGMCIMPAVVMWGISFDTKIYERIEDPALYRVMYLVFAIAFTAPIVVFFIKAAQSVSVRQISDLFTADADGFVPVAELARALNKTEEETIIKVTTMIRRGYLINCNYSAHQRAFLLSDKIGAPTSMYQGAPENKPFVGVHCPGCGASLKIRAATMGTCPYCGKLLIGPNYDPDTNTFNTYK
jgi:hypothetical protein